VRHFIFVAALPCILACHGGGSSARATSPITFPVDHVILAIDSLERGIALLRNATGVTPVIGGVHPGRGTQNALLGLGGGRYLELLAPNPSDTALAARQSAAQRASYFAQFRRLTPVGWAVHVRDIGAERARLVAAGLHPGPVRPGSRATGDGRLLRWQTLDPWGQERGVLPFVIAWDSASRHPSATAPGGCALADLRIVSPAADSLRRGFARAGWPVAVDGGNPEHLEVTLTCPGGQRHFP
jgi:Glyoxalase-like domain